MKKISNDMIDSILEPLIESLPTIPVGKYHDCHDQITISIPLEHKEKYDRLQKLTNQHFSKALKKVVMKSIEIVDLEAV